MQTLLDKGTVPPGGFRYKNAETDAIITAPSIGELFSAVRKHRQSNNLPVPLEMDRQIEDQLCSFMPPGTCHQAIAKPLEYIRKLSLDEVVTATKTIGEWLLKGAQRVDKPEAERRAKICAGCPYNQEVSGCTTCAIDRIRTLVAELCGATGVDSESMLHTCHFCGCALKAAVWFPLDILQKHARDTELLPDWCWKKPK